MIAPVIPQRSTGCPAETLIEYVGGPEGPTESPTGQGAALDQRGLPRRPLDRLHLQGNSLGLAIAPSGESIEAGW